MTTTEQTYSQSAKGVWITRERAIKELWDHSICAEDHEEMLSMTKQRADGRYSAHSLLEALGY